MTGRTLEDFDVCRCGDYRHQHEAGGGACRLNGLGHDPGGGLCLAFQIDETASAAERERRTRDDNPPGRRA